MSLTLGCAVISLFQWYSYRRRHSIFRRYVSAVLKTSSVVVQKSNSLKAGLTNNSLQSLYDTNLLEKVDNIVVKELFSDGETFVSQIRPKLTVDLKAWTAYYSISSHVPFTQEDKEVTVFLESFRPSDVEKFLEEQLNVPPVKSFHILDHGHPVAWSTGPPFGIIMQCSEEDFISLCMSFTDGCIIMEEDLQVQRIISVETKGTAASLVNKEDPEESIVKDTGSQWSNESLADSASMVNIDMLSEVASQDIDGVGPGDQEVEEDDLDIVMMESGSGEALCDSAEMEKLSTAKHTKYIKPPNIVVYCGKKDASRKFENLRQILEQCINTECYVIYHLKHDQLQTVPWTDNAELLVLSDATLHNKEDDIVYKYFEKGGKLISFGSNVDASFLPRRELRRGNGIFNVNYRDWKNVQLMCGRSCYLVNNVNRSDIILSDVVATDESGQVLLVEVTQNVSTPSPGRAVLSQILLDQDPTDVAMTQDSFNQLKKSNPTRLEMLSSLLNHLDINCDRTAPAELSPCFLLTNNKENQTSLIKSISSRIKNNILKSSTVSLLFLADVTSPVTSSILPVITDKVNDGKLLYFNIEDYWLNLHTSKLGNMVLYTDVIPSTMPVLDSMQFSAPDDVGLVAIAGRQTQGKGRGGNSWLSPEGCAMFSLHVKISADNALGKALSYLQHITSLAVVESVRRLPGYENIDLRLKWPNDIYYSDRMKLGGVIVKSSIMDGFCHAIIGCGFNVSNKNPTICINDLVQLHNTQHSTQLKPLSKEQLIARTISIIEAIVSTFQEKGREEFCKAYYSRWLHGGSEVQLESEGNKTFTVTGIDEFGFLEVMSSENKVIAVQPDGNSYDMMRNLIHLKRQ